MWGKKRKLPKLWSEKTFIDFSLQCELELEDWCRVKRKMYCYRSKSFSVSESLLWALILDLHHRQPKNHFSWRVTWQGDFCLLYETVVGAGIGTETQCIQVIVIIVNNQIICKKNNCQRCQALLQFYWALELCAEWQTHYVWSMQRIYIASLQVWHHSTRP